MAANKMKICKHCGAQIAKDAKVCPQCGGKNKPPFFTRPWFLILAALVVLGLLFGGGGGKSGQDDKKVGQVSDSASVTQKEGQDDSAVEAAEESGAKPGEEAAEETKAADQASEPSEEVKTVYHVGDILKDGDTKIVYAASGPYESDNEYLQPKDGNKYVFLKLAFINESAKSDTYISSYSFNAFADGYACDMFFGGEEDLSATLSPGRSTIGFIYFEVPEDAEDIEVEYETNVFTSDKINFVYDGEADSGFELEGDTTRTEGSLSVGDSAQGTGLTVTYLSCEDYESDNMFVTPKEGCHFVSIELEFENTGERDQFITAASFDCYADGVACAQTYIRDDDLSATLSAGRKTKGTVTFEVPDDAEVVEAEYLDNIWTSGRITFTIQ